MMLIRLTAIFTASILIIVGCADPKASRSKRGGDGKNKEAESFDQDAEIGEGDDIDSFGDLLKLAQNIADKQKSAGEGICSEGACLANVNTCEKLNIGKLKYTFSSEEGGKCVLDVQNSCEAWEKKITKKLPAFDSDAENGGEWIAIDVEFCATDETVCSNTRFNKDGKWYSSSTVDIKEMSYFDSNGNFRNKPENKEGATLTGVEETKTVQVCERLDDYCKDSFGDLSNASHSVNQGTGRSINTCSVSPKYCRSKDMYLNSTNVNITAADENDIGITEVDAIEWESECVERADFKASSLICTAHGMEYDSTNNECYSDTKASCDNSGKIWVSDKLIPKYNEILKNYKYLYDLDKSNNQETELNYAGFSYVDFTLPNYVLLGLSEEEATFKGNYPVKPGKRCQYPNIETCKLVNQVFDPYTNTCKDSLKRNLMLVLRKIEIDNSVGCIDHWMEREGPNASDMAENVAGSIATLGILPAIGGWKDGKDIRKEAPFSYEVGDFKFLTSTGDGGDLLKKPIKNIAIPHKKSYAFLVSNVFPVEIKGPGFNFSVKFDVFVKGKALTTGKLLFGSILEDFYYTDTHFPYRYKSLERSLKDGSEETNTNGIENLFAELKGELSRRHIASATAEMSSWFKEGLNHVRLDGADEDNQIAKNLKGNSSTRISYTINRSNWDDSLHKISQIIHFNPTQVYSQEIQRGGLGTGAKVGGGVGVPPGMIIGDATDDAIKKKPGLTELDQSRCYGRVVWSWQWFQGEE